MKTNKTKQHLSLLITGFIQVYFVSVNTYFLSKEFYIGVLFAAFFISFVWSFNVKKVAFGSNLDRFIYALGASLGSMAGLFSSAFLAEILGKIN